MRLIAIAFAASLVAAAPAHAAWKEYTYKELGVAKDFPDEPKLETGVYKTPLAKTAPSVIYSVVKYGITFKMTVVDFSKRAADGANLMAEAAAHEVQGRQVTYTLDDLPLYDKGANSVYGMMLRIQKPDGGRENVVNFFNKGRLYIIEAIVAPDSPNKFSPDIPRFMDTVVFHLQGYGFNFETGHDFPIGDDDPDDRDNRVIPGYKPPPGYSGKVQN
jgi:hypothetical protein